MLEENEIEIIANICCWYDLLGYGKPFIDAGWDLTNELCKNNIQRIILDADWMRGLLSHQSDITKLLLNDGIASAIDVDKEDIDSVYRLLCFLERSIRDYILLNTVDKRGGYPGVRGIITCGHRFSYDVADTVFDVKEYRDYIYHPKMFQMNTAFSKAFIMDEAGSRCGISGAHLYIDKALFELLEGIFSLHQCIAIHYDETNQKRVIEIYINHETFLKLTFEYALVDYKDKGIETELYRLNQIDSLFDRMSKEASFSEMSRIVKIENELNDYFQ